MPLLLLLQQLKVVSWRRVTAIGGAVLIVLLIAYVRLQAIALDQVELVYRNPKQTSLVHTVRVEGPVRIVTRTIREPGGREETMREEVHGPVTTTRSSEFTVEPVFPPAPRLDRWLLGAGIEPFHWGERGAVALHAGYSFRNRLDLCAGITHDRKAELLFTVRF